MRGIRTFLIETPAVWLFVFIVFASLDAVFCAIIFHSMFSTIAMARRSSFFAIIFFICLVIVHDQTIRHYGFL